MTNIMDEIIIIDHKFEELKNKYKKYPEYIFAIMLARGDELNRLIKLTFNKRAATDVNID